MGIICLYFQKIFHNFQHKKTKQAEGKEHCYIQY